MGVRRLIPTLIAATVAVLASGQAAYADLLIQIDKSAQRMTVTENGQQLYEWPVSTGGEGYETPSGTFKPFRMEIDHYSDEYDNAPMPYSVFFTQTGIAVHGTYEARNLANTKVVLTGEIQDAGSVARSQPLPLTPDDYRAPPPQYQRVYEVRPALPTPFFIFGR